MATGRELAQQIREGRFDTTLCALYGAAAIASQRARYLRALELFEQYYGKNRAVRLYSAPGRAELGGNHTDHQHGYGLAAAVNLDLIAVAAQNDDHYIRVKSRGFNKLDVVDLDEPNPQSTESTHSASLIRGIAKGFRVKGGCVSGMDVYTDSNVLRGSGLSSSAAFETGIGTILNHEFNSARFSPAEVAMIGQYAENTYFGKPSGLLDQMASAMGGVLFVDFQKPNAPAVTQIAFDLSAQDEALCVTDTRGSHSELTTEFAAIRGEMEAVAAALGGTVLGQVPEQRLLENLSSLRKRCGDRAVLRALHFYAENRRTAQQAQALEENRFADFLKLVSESGHSSFEYNQNAYCGDCPQSQGIPLALALTQGLLHECGAAAAWRMQGGGFAGTIQAYVPKPELARYHDGMERVFGAGSCYVLSFRAQGGIEVRPDITKQEEFPR